jgi:DNA-binding MarR family transcriptional regulator
MAQDCIAAGLLVRTASQTDGRRSVLQMTKTGRRLLEQVAREQRETFEEITAHWSDDDRLSLARLITRYSDDAAAWQARQTH